MLLFAHAGFMALASYWIITSLSKTLPWSCEWLDDRISLTGNAITTTMTTTTWKSRGVPCSEKCIYSSGLCPLQNWYSPLKKNAVIDMKMKEENTLGEEHDTVQSSTGNTKAEIELRAHLSNLRWWTKVRSCPTFGKKSSESWALNLP